MSGSKDSQFLTRTVQKFVNINYVGNNTLIPVMHWMGDRENNQISIRKRDTRFLHRKSYAPNKVELQFSL